jgi:hypothetical protein
MIPISWAECKLNISFNIKKTILLVNNMKRLLYLVAIAVLFFTCKKDDEAFNGYLDKLKEYPLYNNAETVNYVFSYMDSSNVNLKNLKHKYKLDSIAGSGDELSRIFNLMLWVNNNLRHDGNSQNPYPMNADNIIETCRNGNKAVNCRMLATVLNEIYLATGFKSRFVTCKPYEHEFSDCHVVTIVYSNSQKKWIMMDPSFAGFFKDGNNVYLNLMEVRERLINNETLMISDYLNHNRGKYTKQYYKTYMAKNLFRFECGVKSEYNYESQPANYKKYIELVPLNYETDNSNNLFTRNSNAFWNVP